MWGTNTLFFCKDLITIYKYFEKISHCFKVIYKTYVPVFELWKSEIDTVLSSPCIPYDNLRCFLLLQNTFLKVLVLKVII